MAEREMFVTKVFRENEKATEKTVINRGGAGSSKTYSLCQFYLFKRLLVIPNRRVIVIRKTRASLDLSVYKAFFDLMKEYNLYDENKHNKSSMTYTFGNGAFVCFSGMEDTEKIKSTEWDDIWIEEANQLRREDYLFLKSTRLSRGLIRGYARPQIRLSYNPVMCWIKGIEDGKDTKLIKSTYKDNPTANPDFIAELEALKDQDYNYYLIYALGEHATLKNVIYDQINVTTEVPQDYDEMIYGLDFGFSNSKTALLELKIVGNRVYERLIIYRTHLTNPDIITILKEKCVKSTVPIYADYSNASAIEEIFQAGFNILPCIKGQESVRAGIDVCKRYKYFCSPDETDLIDEHNGYVWQTNKNGDLVNEPVKFRDHAMDARRYALFTHLKKNSGVTNFKEALQDVREGNDSEIIEGDW